MIDAEKDHFLSIINSIQASGELKEFSNNLNFDITNEGLRIQIMDSDDRAMFKLDSYELQPYMYKILNIVGKMIKNQPNYIAISSHTAKVKSPSKNADYWLLSAQRTNEVRRFLTTTPELLLDNSQIIKIIGKADKEPFDIKNYYSPKNIRISITLLKQTSY